MMKFAIAFAVVGSLALAGCGGASCKKVEAAKTCSPACKTDGTEYCDNGTCKALKNCSPACKTDGSEMCDYSAGTCKAIKCTADKIKTCKATEYCDEASGSCKTTPVCSPVCAAGEVCSE
jgi:hypothetical protein